MLFQHSSVLVMKLDFISQTSLILKIVRQLNEVKLRIDVFVELLVFGIDFSLRLFVLIMLRFVGV